MSAAIPKVIPSIDRRNASQPPASSSPTVAGNLAFESLLQHLQSCLLCKQELILALLGDGHDYGTAATVVQTLYSLSSSPDMQRIRPSPKSDMSHRPEKLAQGSSHDRTADYYEAELGNGEALRTAAEYDMSVLPATVERFSPPLHCEPLLKRQNAFEHISTQGSFESSSAAETEWLMECEPDEYCEDEAASALCGIWSPTIPDLSHCPIFYLLRRQNAFEIPPKTRAEDWSKYI